MVFSKAEEMGRRARFARAMFAMLRLARSLSLSFDFPFQGFNFLLQRSFISLDSVLVIVLYYCNETS